MLHLFIKRENHFALSRPNVRGNASLREKKNWFILVFNHCISMDRWVAVSRVLFTTLVNENFKFSFQKNDLNESIRTKELSYKKDKSF